MSDTIEPQKLAFSIREACAASSLGKTTLYTHIKSSRLKAIRVGGRTLITAESLHNFLSGEAAE